MKYTINDFRRDYPDDKTCLAAIFKNKYPDGIECSECHHKDCYYPIANRRSYGCSWCGHQVNPTAGTIFHKSPTRLVSWFHAIFLMGQSKNGVAAKELERQLGVTYKCAWRIAKQIRLMMKSSGRILEGIVEADETYIGGKRKGKRGRGAAGKTAVFGMAERGGEIRTQVVDNVKGKTLRPLIQANIEPGSTVSTDELASYRKVGALGYTHGTVTHGKGEYVKGIFHTNNLEGFWSQLKRSINGTYHAVSRKHLPAYLDEFSFRYDHRADAAPLPLTMFSRVARPA